MPVWENYLTEDEIWSVVMFIYDQNGWKPRRWEAARRSGKIRRARNSPRHRRREVQIDAPFGDSPALARHQRDTGTKACKEPNLLFSPEDERGNLPADAVVSTLSCVGRATRLLAVVHDSCSRNASEAQRQSRLQQVVLRLSRRDRRGQRVGAKTMLPHPATSPRQSTRFEPPPAARFPPTTTCVTSSRSGMPGTGMPEWKSRLSAPRAARRRAVPQDLLRTPSRAPAKALAHRQKPPGGDGDSRRQGDLPEARVLKCHGTAGRGDGKSAPTLKDD